MKSLAHYVLIDTLRSQRWVAPVLSYGAIIAIVCAQAGSVLPTYAISAAALLFIATWLSIVVLNNESPIQQSITTVCAGSHLKIRLSKLLVAFSIAAVLGIVGMIGPPLASTGGVTVAELLAGLVAQLLTALTGVALGALCSRPLVNRRAWSLLIGAGVCLATVVTPHCPPTRQLLVLFNETGSFALALPVLLIAVETLVITVAALAASLRIAQTRT